MTFEEYLVWSYPRAKDDVNVERPKRCVPNTWKKYFGWLEEEASNFHVVDDEDWLGDEKERELALINEFVIPAYYDAQKLLPKCKSLSEAIFKALESRIPGIQVFL
ncbi:hypothetical protein MKW98_001249 [Papaver atlanticum]|uniref:Uncharacterized protein n=1 Tax=Papaver atlanticum TaxID=357466 RepID=A0AAD4XKB3_9MAGN|nr:hypothetical protein MKW98_001249 [Papaver atlanticum]